MLFFSFFLVLFSVFVSFFQGVKHVDSIFSDPFLETSFYQLLFHLFSYRNLLRRPLLIGVVILVSCPVLSSDFNGLGWILGLN